ncbi:MULTISPECIES: hypothetical protein [Nocardiopsis]|uniref:Uncharacterized protein n=1 Tax=Nocardiopsis lambiniae TaxID=3075539 RepID=A0ABU2M3A5_9ACTN|nr:MULTISPECIES: hypothetical protein [unclassified Nocardiopsis]MDE3725013.1 hypothetical protein [Nocardiopsis sp. N85]MDT0327058.1 hypothetical protein [Nocardiopsis sp. DSM 44743]
MDRPPQTTEVVTTAAVGPKKIRLALDVDQARQFSALLTIAGADRSLAMAILDATDLADTP